jgi:hypothetical protein
MMRSQSIHQCKNARRSGRHSAGSGKTRIAVSDSPAAAPSIPSRYPLIARSHQAGPEPTSPQADRGSRCNLASASPKPVAKSP